MNPHGSDEADAPAAREIIADTPDIRGVDYSTAGRACWGV